MDKGNIKKERGKYYKRLEKQNIHCLRTKVELDKCLNGRTSVNDCQQLLDDYIECNKKFHEQGFRKQMKQILPPESFGIFYVPRKNRPKRTNEKVQQCYDDVEHFIKCIETRNYRDMNNEECQKLKSNIITCSNEIFWRFYEK